MNEPDVVHEPAASADTELVELAATGKRIVTEAARVLVGLENEVAACLTAALAGGHVLLEGPPGVAKTLLVRTLAETLGGSFGRVQFTPDLMPADVVGTEHVSGRPRPRSAFVPGPVFAQVLLCGRDQPRAGQDAVGAAGGDAGAGR